MKFCFDSLAENRVEEEEAPSGDDPQVASKSRKLRDTVDFFAESESSVGASCEVNAALESSSGLSKPTVLFAVAVQ